jgi:DNA (cytosine-5)-methyltransferase 1
VKICNLYSGIGGNRKLWDKEHLGFDVDITAIEIEPKVAKIYQDFFPNDKVIIADAHQYLLEHFKEYDFIWSSPPCPSHSDIRRMGVDVGQNKPIYPDMKLYEEVIFLKYFFEGKWVVENVKPYYDLLIRGAEIDRHIFWSNFFIRNIDLGKSHIIKNITGSKAVYGFDISNYKLSQRKDQVLRNCVNPELGLHILLESKRNIHPELFDTTGADNGQG